MPTIVEPIGGGLAPGSTAVITLPTGHMFTSSLSGYIPVISNNHQVYSDILSYDPSIDDIGKQFTVTVTIA